MSSSKGKAFSALRLIVIASVSILVFSHFVSCNNLWATSKGTDDDKTTASFKPTQVQLDAMNSGINAEKLQTIENDITGLESDVVVINGKIDDINEILSTPQTTSDDGGVTLTPVQQAAVNSGITTSKVEQIETNKTNIAANAESIATNTGNIATNTQNIATNTQNITNHTSNTSNPHNVTKAQVGLGDVVNTGDSAIPVSGGTTKFTTGGAYTELNKKVDKTSVVTAIDSNSTNDQIPSAKSVWDSFLSVQENAGSFTPVQAQLDAMNSGITSAKVTQIETNKTNIAANAESIATNTGNIATNTQNITTNTENIATNTQNITNHTSNTSNPHNVTKAQVGLGDVVNTGDSATPVSGGTTKFTTGGAYTELNKKVDKTSVVTAIDSNSTNDTAPTSKAVYDYIDSKKKYIHHFVYYDKSSFEYPLFWWDVINDDPDYTFDKLKTFLTDNGFTSISNTYTFGGGGITSTFSISTSSGNQTLGRSFTGIFMDDSTLRYKSNYNGWGELGEQYTNMTTYRII